MNITWVTRSFLDYRIPVFKALDDLCGHRLTVIYYRDVVPERVRKKLENILGNRAIAREKEIRIGNRPKIDNAVKTGISVRIPISPGLIQQVIASKPDALVSDGFMQWTYAALAARALKKIPHVMCYERTAHVERNAGKVRIWYRKFVSRWIDAIDCNGTLCGEYVKSLGYDPNRLTFGHMAADIDGMKIKMAEYNTNDSKELREQLGVKGIMIVYVGRLYQLKGVVELLNGWQMFREQNPNVKATLVYVGTGQQEDELRSLVADKNIPDVVLTGGVDYDIVDKYYNAADCFIIATKGDNWSLVVPEAMACGLPIASSIYNGCWPELVTPKNGWTFNPLKPNDIVRVFGEIIENAENLSAMGEESRKIVENHSPLNAAKSIMDAISLAQKHCKK